MTPGPLAAGKTCANDFQCATLLCVEASEGKRTCRHPCAIAVASGCAAGEECSELPELDGIGACLPEGTQKPDVTEEQDVTSLPDVAGYVYTPKKSDSGGCSATPVGSLPSLLLFLLVLVPVYVRRRFW